MLLQNCWSLEFYINSFSRNVAPLPPPPPPSKSATVSKWPEGKYSDIVADILCATRAVYRFSSATLLVSSCECAMVKVIS